MSTPPTEYLTTLWNRSALVASLLDEPTEKHTLVSSLSISRSTVERGLDELEEQGLIDRGSNAIALTPFARLIISLHDDFDADVEMIATEMGDEDGPPVWSETERARVVELVTDRLDVLLCAQLPQHKRDLIEAVDQSRSTVDRAIRELAMAGLIRRTSEGYQTTPVCRRVVRRYERLLATLTNVIEAKDVLAHLPEHCSIPAALFVDCDIERTDATVPYRLLSGVRERIGMAERIRSVIPLLPNPQLLDCYHHEVVRHGTTVDVVIDDAVSDVLTEEFPGPVAEMTATQTGSFSAFVADVPHLGMIIADVPRRTSVSVVVYTDQLTEYAAIHTENETAIGWATAYYEHAHEQACDVTNDLETVTTDTEPVALSTVLDAGRVEREAEGFIQITSEYFTRHPPTPPTTSWRTGFDLTDVHAGYAIDREHVCDGDRHSFTASLTERLDEATDLALIGPPGSGKSTVCKAVACRWYERSYGPVFYREYGTGVTFDSPSILCGQLRAAATTGHVLVVVEDAVRAEANAIFRVMVEFRDDPSVTFLLDARAGEWDDPSALPVDARCETYRTESIEAVTMPPLDEQECERLIDHFQESVDRNISVSIGHLLQGDTQPSGESHTLLLLLHRLVFHTLPVSTDASTPTTLVEDVQKVHATLSAAGDSALAVGVLVNVLNAAGLGVYPSLVYALVGEETTVTDVHNALSTLEGRIIFDRKHDGQQRQRRADVAYRTVHETWSTLFLERLLEAESEIMARRRFDRCVTALFDVATTSHRERLTTIVGRSSLLGRIEQAPTQWVDTAIERIFRIGVNRPQLVPLFGTTDTSSIPVAGVCSPEMEPRCAQWRGRMFLETGALDRAHRELDHAIASTGDEDQSDEAQKIQADSYKDLGGVAWKQSDPVEAESYLLRAIEHYRKINDREGEAACHSNLGIIALDRGDLDRAAAYYKRGYDTFCEINASRKQRVISLGQLGWVAALRGSLNRAVEYLDRGIALGRGIDKEYEIVFPLVDRAEVARWRENLGRAETFCKQGLDIARAAGQPYGIAYSHVGLGRIAVDRGDLETATEQIQRGLDMYTDIEATQGKAQGNRWLGTIARKQRESETAHHHLTAALSFSRAGGYRYEEANTLVELGLLAAVTDSHECARTHFAEAVDIYHEMGAARDVVVSQQQLAQTCELLGETETALSHYETAATIAKDKEFEKLYASVSERRDRLAELE